MALSVTRLAASGRIGKSFRFPGTCGAFQAEDVLAAIGFGDSHLDACIANRAYIRGDRIAKEHPHPHHLAGMEQPFFKSGSVGHPIRVTRSSVAAYPASFRHIYPGRSRCTSRVPGARGTAGHRNSHRTRPGQLRSNRDIPDRRFPLPPRPFRAASRSIRKTTCRRGKTDSSDAAGTNNWKTRGRPSKCLIFRCRWRRCPLRS